MAMRKKTGRPRPTKKGPRRKTRSKDKPSREAPPARDKDNPAKKHNGQGGTPWHRTKARVKPKVPPKPRSGVRARPGGRR